MSGLIVRFVNKAPMQTASSIAPPAFRVFLKRSRKHESTIRNRPSSPRYVIKVRKGVRKAPAADA